jgi:hypothetical protein
MTLLFTSYVCDTCDGIKPKAPEKTSTLYRLKLAYDMKARVGFGGELDVDEEENRISAWLVSQGQSVGEEFSFARMTTLQGSRFYRVTFPWGILHVMEADLPPADSVEVH